MIYTLLINTAAVFIGSLFFRGIEVRNLFTAFGVALVLAIVNVLIRPFILILTLPLTILTLGLFILVINAWMLMLTSKIVKGFEVSGFFTALFFSIILSVLNALLFALFGGPAG